MKVVCFLVVFVVVGVCECCIVVGVYGIFRYVFLVFEFVFECVEDDVFFWEFYFGFFVVCGW